MRSCRPAALLPVLPLLAVLAVLALAVGLVAFTPRPSAVGAPGPGVLGRNVPGHPAPELEGLTDWMNTQPLTLATLRAEKRVVLVDFWTYTCVNCIRTLPYLKQWHARYGGAGLTVIGVHAPEFDFERDRDNVRRAVEANGIGYAVALDNDMKTWAAFDNNAWPAKYLIGGDGQIGFTHTGEGGYADTERAIREALLAAGHDVSAISSGGLPPPTPDPRATTITRELYGGYERNYTTRGVYAAQREYYGGADQTHDYIDAAGVRSDDVWYLQGRWRNEREAVVHARETKNVEDYLAFRFTARSVNAVMKPRTVGSSYDVVVEIDGRPLRREEAGVDIRFDDAGRSLVTVQVPRMYSLAILPALGDHELKMRSNSSDFAMYAITFGIYTAGS